METNDQIKIVWSTHQWDKKLNMIEFWDEYDKSWEEKLYIFLKIENIFTYRTGFKVLEIYLMIERIKGQHNIGQNLQIQLKN